jgi:osomolarity two-component system, response regulator SKN7
VEGRATQGTLEKREAFRPFHLYRKNFRYFRGKLFSIQSGQHSGIVAWSEDGTHFAILDVERFEQEILPAYFRHRNFSSFVRQLNMYDFHKIRNEQNKSIF